MSKKKRRHDSHGIDANDKNERNPLPRTKRKRNRKSNEKGLPNHKELIKLAVAYLKFQHVHFPNLVESGTLPPLEIESYEQMATDYINRHTEDGHVDYGVLEPGLASINTGLFYGRYSCANSNPVSIADQMLKALVYAHERDFFIPWSLVFADYSVTGLTRNRLGYTAAKNQIEAEQSTFSVIFIDDFTRASRDEIEWWELAQDCKLNQKNLLGASDGFDLAHPYSDIMITVYGLVSRLFIKGLREKVFRGMAGAAKRGTVLGKLNLAFTRIPAVDEHGNLLFDQEGDPIYTRCHDPEGVEIARRALSLRRRPSCEIGIG